MIEPTELARQLRGLCIDWSGEQLADEATSRIDVTCGRLRLAAKAIDDLTAENERLRKLVREAFCEGYEAHLRGIDWRVGRCWTESRSCAALKGTTDEP